MREIGLDELKVIQMDVMSAVHRFCEEHNLKYSLACGSMLGAARHKGYIPWDDDIDIYVPRDDYERMADIFPELWEGKYSFITLKRDKRWFTPYGKGCDVRTGLKEKNGHNYTLGVNIDVFPVDDVPDNETDWLRYNRTRRRIVFLHNMSVCIDQFPIFNFKPGKSRLRVLCATIFILFMRCTSARFWARVLQWYAKKNNGKGYTHMFECVMGMFQKHPFDKSLFDHRVLMPFEDRMFMCFEDYDNYLSNGFGNWRELPPVEKRVSHHTFKAWWK